ncbi:NAD-dependent deacetylase [Aurantibacter sp.]|uniref:SIR2 family NAD-dependent protein deacylase n=1 Tax=Aurantibacter sp. TaxID=2807103 RepID=UPI0035C7A219
MKKHIVVLTGAGISAESGIKTFRDANGLWEGHNVMDVASPEGFAKNPELVLEFYNQRRKQLLEVKPNKAHFDLVQLEQNYNVTIITQNVDDLHERAGSTNVIHLHGELLKSRPISSDKEIYDCKTDIVLGDKNKKGEQLRPHIVWFGENVPLIDKAVSICETADVLLIIGTSLQVYPAASLMKYAPKYIPKFYIDASPAPTNDISIQVIPKKATIGVKEVINILDK